jgi:hypothetical protein
VLRDAPLTPSARQTRCRFAVVGIQLVTVDSVSADKGKRTSGIGSLKLYCEGRNVELVMACLNREG